MIDINKHYYGFKYPDGYNELIRLQLKDFEYWYFFPEDQLENRIIGLKKRYPQRRLVPFARRDDCDDIACFEVGHGDKVFIIHDFASYGYEERKEYKNIWIWVQDAVNELVRKKNN